MHPVQRHSRRSHKLHQFQQQRVSAATVGSAETSPDCALQTPSKRRYHNWKHQVLPLAPLVTIGKILSGVLHIL